MQTALHGNDEEGFCFFLWQFLFEDVKSEGMFGSLIAKSGRGKKNQLENITKFYIRFQLKCRTYFVFRQNWLNNLTDDPH